MAMDVLTGDVNKDIQPTQEAVGEAMLGEVNPVGMTREAFSSSPDLLFHGASEEFNFRRDFDYSIEKSSSMHSHTVGEGFYTTPSRADAVLFSQAFGAGEKPVVLEVLPYQARVLDFRRKDLSGNARVPEGMLAQYLQGYGEAYEAQWGKYDPEEDSEFIRTHPVDEPDEEKRLRAATFEDMFATKPSSHSQERSERVSRLMAYGDATNYLNVLKSKIGKTEGVDLREMLSIKGEARASEYASRIFKEFMLGQGYDGVVYVEGGDHPDHVKPVSYVFYNLEKVGTYEAWNSDKTQTGFRI